MLHYEVFESSCDTDRYIVLLHGFGGNNRVWKNQIPLLQKKFNVLAITLPSHGDSELKLSKMGSTLDVVVGEITQVLDERGIQRAVFMGVSLGTIFIKYMEMRCGSYIDKAILVGALGTVGKPLRRAVNVFAKIGDRALLRGGEAVGVLHNELAAAHQAKAGTELVAELVLNVIQVDGQLLIGA